MSSPITKEVIIERLKIKNIELLDDYVVGKDTTKHHKKCKCLICGYGPNENWKPALMTFFSTHNTGCPNCAGQIKYTNDNIDQRLIKENRNIKRIGNCITVHIAIDWLCLTCKRVWPANPD